MASSWHPCAIEFGLLTKEPKKRVSGQKNSKIRCYAYSSIQELVENMGYEVLHGIVDCLWVIGEPISVFKEAVSEKETGILTEVDSYDWIYFPAHVRWRRSL
jgi:hypothetical protein